MKKRLLGKVNKQEVNLTVCYYLLSKNVERYVFFFYDPLKKEPIFKWIYYLEEGKDDDFKEKFKEVLIQNNYKVNRPVILSMCNKETKINSIKLPKKISFFFKYRKIIEADLKDKYGPEVKSLYYIDNKIDGFEEKDAEKKAERERKAAEVETKRVAKLKKQLEEQKKKEGFVSPVKETKLSVFESFFAVIGSFILISLSLLIVLIRNKVEHIEKYLYAFGILSLVFLATFIVLDLIKHHQSKRLKREKPRFFLKDLFNFITYTIALGVMVFSEFIWLNLQENALTKTSTLLYIALSIFFILVAYLWVDYKGKYTHKLYLTVGEAIKEIKNPFVRSPKVSTEPEEDLYFEGVTPNTLFNLSEKKIRLFKPKSERAVVSFRQLLVSQYSYKQATTALKNLGLKVKEIRTLPSLINQFHLKYASGVNEIVVYNEAGFTLLVGIVNDKIVDAVFMEGMEKTREKEGKSYTLHLQSFYNIFSSLLWSCQRETIKIDRVLYFANSQRKIDQIKKQKIFGLPYVIVPNTDVLFGVSDKEVKGNIITKAFTLVETVVAFSVFILTGLIVATLAISISNMNTFSCDQNKANIYINNIRETLRSVPDNDTFETITSYKLEDEETEKEDVYYIDYNFNMSSRSKESTDQTYEVSFNISKITYSDTAPALKGYTTYSITISKITRIDRNRNLIQPVTIEVTK